MPKIITIIIIILILILLFVLFLTENVENESYHSFNEIRDKLKTGDIILFSCRRYYSLLEEIIYKSRTNLIGTIYGHVGVVIKKNNKLYLVEACGYKLCGYDKAYHLNNYNQGGVRIIKLETMLNEYHKKYNGVYAVKFISEEIPYQKIMEKIKKYKNITFQSMKTLAFLAIVDIFISHDLAINISKKCDKNKMICTEFLYNLLYDCGVLKEYPVKLFWTHLFTENIFTKLENIKYSGPVKFMAPCVSANHVHFTSLMMK